MKKLHIVGYAAMLSSVLIALILLLLALRENARRTAENQQLRYRVDGIEESAQRLTDGEGVLYIYSMPDTNGLRSCFAGMYSDNYFSR